MRCQLNLRTFVSAEDVESELEAVDAYCLVLFDTTDAKTIELIEDETDVILIEIKMQQRRKIRNRMHRRKKRRRWRRSMRLQGLPILKQYHKGDTNHLSSTSVLTCRLLMFICTLFTV